jgi:hypothetical protein
LIEVRKPRLLSLIFSIFLGIPVLVAVLSNVLPHSIRFPIELVGLLLVSPVRYFSEQLVTIGKIGFRIHPLAWFISLAAYTVLAAVLALLFRCVGVNRSAG